jgi:UDP-GlcNAc:undecaprenyl-phosphate/decaprenyl-phosphate GlcNAc-1-phosphate transferase
MREYLVALCVAWIVTYLCTGMVRVGAVRFGAVTALRDRDVHTVPTPRLGGVGMYLGMLAAFLVGSKMPMLHEWVYASTTTVHALLWGTGILILLGIADDRWGVDAVIKLAGQTLAAAVVVLNGVEIQWLPIPGLGLFVFDPRLGAVVSILIVVVMVNAVNFVDGLDGLAAGTVGIGALVFFVYAYRLQSGYQIFGAAPGTLVVAVVVGMCLGFLCHNWSPARIFMGDSGSMLLGMLMATATILLCGHIDPDKIRQVAGSQTFATHKTLPVLILPLVLPFTILALPLADMAMAVIRRTKAGRSPFAADKEHMHHRLLEIGHSRVRAVLIMYFWSALISVTVVMFSVTTQSRPLIYIAMGTMVLGLVLLMMPRVRRYLDDREQRRIAAAERIRAEAAGRPVPAAGGAPALADPAPSRPGARFSRAGAVETGAPGALEPSEALSAAGPADPRSRP